MTAARFEIRGWHVLAAILAFFGTIIAVNVTFAVYAVRSFPGEDVRRSYLQGLRYNDTLAERRAQAALGWRVTTELRGEADGPLLVVTLAADHASFVDGAALSGVLEWPTTAQFDRTLSFEPLGHGRYAARLGALQSGRWRLRARAERGDGALDFESELTWQP